VSQRTHFETNVPASFIRWVSAFRHSCRAWWRSPLSQFFRCESNNRPPRSARYHNGYSAASKVLLMAQAFVSRYQHVKSRGLGGIEQFAVLKLVPSFLCSGAHRMALQNWRRSTGVLWSNRTRTTGHTRAAWKAERYALRPASLLRLMSSSAHADPPALIVAPQIVARLLFGADLSFAGIGMSRVAGISLVAVGWAGPPRGEDRSRYVVSVKAGQTVPSGSAMPASASRQCR
jgi:hypothetical protein